MAAAGMSGESQLQRIIRDLHEAVAELSKEYKESGEPVTDDSTNLHKFSYKLEYLLQFDQKEKTTFLGTRKDYWDYFSDCLAKIKGANDGIRFVKSIAELKTSLGKGRAFIRYSLVHQRLADTLQQCLMNHRVTSDWYYARSPLLKPHLGADIIDHLYELNEVQFDVASRGHDLDASWPTFARRTLGNVNSPGHMWKPPSRSSSINSLASTYSQQAPEFPSSPDYGHSSLNDPNESLPVCMEDISAIEDLRLELDQSELKQQDLFGKVQLLSEDNAALTAINEKLQSQLEGSLAAQERLQSSQEILKGREEALSREVEAHRTEIKAKEGQHALLQEKLEAAEQKNLELIAKLDGFLNEKGQQAASYFDSAQKIHELLDKLKEAEKGKMEAVVETAELKRRAEKLEEELKVKEAASKDQKAKLTSVSEEKAKLEARAADQSTTLEKLQGDLTLREKEASNLQKQLQNLQRSLEGKDEELDTVKKRAQQDLDEQQASSDGFKESLEVKVAAVTDELKRKEAELCSSCETLQKLEAKNQSLTTQRDELTTSLAERDEKIKEQAEKIEEYETQRANLLESNKKLLSTVTKKEELHNELTETRAALEAELVSLRVSEKQLRGQMDNSKISVDEKEKALREENCRLDESLQRATMAAKMSETALKRLEQENRSLQDEQDKLNSTVSRVQADLKNVHQKNEELQSNIKALDKKEVALQKELDAKNERLEGKEEDLVRLLSTVKDLEAKNKELEIVKATAEATCARQTEVIERVTAEKQAVESSQLQKRAAHVKENQEVTAKLTMVESQLEVHVKEVSRLQAELLDLKVQVQRSEEEKHKSQALLVVTEAQRDELRSLTEKLKSQTEALNQTHVAELMECKKKEEAFVEQRDREVAARSELAVSLTAIQEELLKVKAENNRLALENNEIRESLHRANTEMAELGMTVCKLNAEKEEASEHWAGRASEIEELRNNVEQLEECKEKLQLENHRLQEELRQNESLAETNTELQEQLEKTKKQMQSVKDSCREEIDAVKFQISSETMNHQVSLKSLNEQLKKCKVQAQEDQMNVSSLQARVSELEAENEEYLQLVGEKDARITTAEDTIRENESEIQQLRNTATSAEEERSAVQRLCEELKQKLAATEAEKQREYLKMAAEVDDLNRTKSNLEERLIELIRDKDALWQKSDALEFEQKLRAEERWWLVDKEAIHCLDCQGQFTWFLRRHHCRICGRIFCYNCSNNFVMTKHSGKKERCCRDCYTQHSTVVKRFTQAELSASEVLSPPPEAAHPQPPPEPAPYNPTPRVADPNNKSDDGGYDIITEEEVNGTYDSDTNSQTTGGSLDGEQDQQHQGTNEIGTGDVTPDEEHMPTFQDSEINLLKSGEVTMAVSLSTDDISQFGDGTKELFIRSSCYSVITVTVADCGPTISWMFSSDPRSISFSVVYQESSDIQLEQSKVLIPLTRCNSHKETIQGQLKVRHPGLYMLIFDNSFSRFISKKVFYHLTMEKPVIYDGSDGP
ncbi:FYVE and coiled-coil domain-containing protein 1 [Nematolebias whitei]|uniref:FYVE and coiled-coil domain-containing protein 1 n=1 Tax=Nematolebias whitei TaxID=451745 RepID=UPI001897F727|nr:FYVE and coiled-coil domain-containing protein 1 [Nematolebias whitei]